MNRRNWLAVLCVASLFSLGYFREYVFVNLNWELKFKYWHSEVDYNVIPLFRYFSYNTLWYGKWVLTLLFSALFWLLSTAVIYLRFRQQRAIWLFTFLYLALILCSGLIMSYAFVSGQWEIPYLIARQLMGLAQSPVPLMLGFPALWLLQSLEKPREKSGHPL